MSPPSSITTTPSFTSRGRGQGIGRFIILPRHTLTGVIQPSAINEYIPLDSVFHDSYTPFMNRRDSWLKNLLLWVVGLILVINYFVIQIYGDIIRSSNLFIASPLIFYPLAFINLLLGLGVILQLAREAWLGRKSNRIALSHR
jgi:hypothetical protein